MGRLTRDSGERHVPVQVSETELAACPATHQPLAALVHSLARGTLVLVRQRLPRKRDVREGAQQASTYSAS